MIPADPETPILQASVIPFRRRNGRIEFCLITTRKGNWVFPKGIIDPGETADQTALKEAWEEAGLRGRLVGPPLGEYEYAKWGTTVAVTVLLMEVSAAEAAWEEDWRLRRWVTAAEAVNVVSRRELKTFLSVAMALLARGDVAKDGE
jgi:phosphohistidine phosphatase